MNIRITDATAEHIPQIAALEQKYFSIPWNEKMLETCLQKQYVFLTALDGEKIVGYVSAQCVLDECYFNNIAVDADYRRQGIARAILEALDKKAAERDMAFISLEVRDGNTGAIRLYSECGYKEVGRRQSYYHKPTEDAVIMTKFLK